MDFISFAPHTAVGKMCYLKMLPTMIDLMLIPNMGGPFHNFILVLYRSSQYFAAPKSLEDTFNR